MKKKVIIYVLLVTILVVGIAGTAVARTARQTIEVVYNNIKVVVDGRQADLKDAAGNAVEPFIYNGTVYLPLRACVNAITGGSVEVGWDPGTATVTIGDSTSSGKVGLHELKDFNGNPASHDNSSGQNKLTIRGAEIIPFNLGTSEVGIALDGKYAQLTGKLALIIPGYTRNLVIFGDGNVIGEYRPVFGDYPIDVNVSLIGVNTLQFAYQFPSGLVSTPNTTAPHFYNIELEKFK